MVPMQKKIFLKIVLLAAVAALAFLMPPATATIVRQALSDAYIQVSTFVAFTLGVFYMLEHAFKLDTDALLEKYPKWHVPLAAFMGVLPGCGGAIIVITQYVSGRLGFASVVAVLTATMGDAAFLLLAREPQTAMMVFSICLCAGTGFGMLVEMIHGPDFLREERETRREFLAHTERPGIIGMARWPWIAVMIPGLALALGNALQLDTDAWFGMLATYQPTLWIGMTGSLLAMTMWALSPNSGPALVNLAGKMTETSGWKIHVERIVIDTNFVTVWVVMAYLAFELTVLWGGIDLKALFSVYAPLLPLMGVLMGFIPGCGPQILVTTFYLNGLIPLSAQLGNAISNDGDALFPAIALSPRTALLATAYTAIPGLMVAYGWYFLME